MEIRQLKQKLEKIGGMDEEIEREYAEVNERFEFIKNQVEDLGATIETLNRLARELEKQIDAGFNQALKKINQQFDYYFKKLFGGGQAGLVLTRMEAGGAAGEAEGTSDTAAEGEESGSGVEEEIGEKEIWEGLEIEAVPPGKKVRHLNALSGGEKSMAALALVCAVIAYNPPPFVILDEADASLDESNTQKFADILEHLEDKTQFVAITHNRVTMEKAGVLYGITLDSDNTSKILSVSLEEAKQKAAR